MIGYVKHFDSNKTMSFKVINNQLLKKYTKIWERVSSLMNIESDSESVYGDNDKYIKTKVKSYGDKSKYKLSRQKNTKRRCIIQVFLLIMLGSVIRVNKKYCPQTLLEECKYKKKIKTENLINDDLVSSSPDESDNESDESKWN